MLNGRNSDIVVIVVTDLKILKLSSHSSLSRYCLGIYLHSHKFEMVKISLTALSLISCRVHFGLNDLGSWEESRTIENCNKLSSIPEMMAMASRYNGRRFYYCIYMKNMQSKMLPWRWCCRVHFRWEK